MRASGIVGCLCFVAVSMIALAPAGLLAQQEQSREPFKIFDNLYYVGIDFVSSYLVTTSDGLILLDSTFAESADMVLENVRTLGFDPADIEYVFVSHGHGDHAAGAPRIKAVTGARVGMTREDWAMTGVPADLVIADDESIALGDTTFHFYVTPGHTPGVLSMEFPVRDGVRTYKAFMFGGVGLNFSGVDRTEMYLDSVRRLQAMDGIEVSVTNHQGAGQIFARADRLAGRRAGDSHPFVDPDGFTRWLERLERNAEAKLVEERAAR